MTTSTRSRSLWSARHGYASVARELGELAAGGLLPRRSSRAIHPCALLPLPFPVADAARSPVVLVPGYGGNRTNWRPLEQALTAAGFTDLHVLAYDVTASDVPALAAGLSATCRAVLRTARASQVHMVGHSLGGVLIRYAVTRLGMAESVGTVTTVASPHRGTQLARLGRGPVAAALRPGSALLDELTDQPAQGVRWLAFYSDLDVVVTPRSARLDQSGPDVANVLVPTHGHLSILRSAQVVQGVVEHLLDNEQRHPTASIQLRAA